MFIILGLIAGAIGSVIVRLIFAELDRRAWRAHWQDQQRKRDVQAEFARQDRDKFRAKLEASRLARQAAR